MRVVRERGVRRRAAARPHRRRRDRSPPGTHEVAAGGHLLQHCLENMANMPGVKVNLFYEWPKDAAGRDDASTVVFIGNTFPANHLPNAAQTRARLLVHRTS